MATLPKPPIKTQSKVKILYIPGTAKEKPQQGRIISVGPFLLSTAHAN